ncbi:hypothetical protein BH10BAC4_BH10BAC4_04710 [soil metagenome]
MKRIIPLLSIVLATCSPAEKSDKTFDDTFSAYVSAFNGSEYDKFLTFLPSQTFEKVSKEQIIQYYKKAERTIGQTKIQDYEFTKMGPVLSKGDSVFRRIRYKSTIVNYSNRDTINPAALLYLKNIYGEANLEYDSTQRMYIIHQTKDLIFMRANDSKWTFLEFDSTKENKLIKRLVPLEISTRL